MVHAKKSLGQNFLKSKAALASMCTAATLNTEDIVLEIGPGKGALTETLLPHIAKLIAIEKDTELTDYLKEKFPTETTDGKLDLREGDALEFDPGTIRAPYKLVANIPYYITGILIRTFLSGTHQPTRMVLLVQKEVAQRIVARDKKESILSLSVKAYGTPTYIETVKARYFSPVPKVDSAILLIENISKDFFKDFSEEHYFEIVKHGFAHKRKMLFGNLKEFYPAEKLQTIFATLNLSLKCRAEDLSLEEWKQLAKVL